MYNGTGGSLLIVVLYHAAAKPRGPKHLSVTHRKQATRS
jgi:hypothetical protein